jgi:hypothetical protein
MQDAATERQNEARRLQIAAHRLSTRAGDL